MAQEYSAGDVRPEGEIYFSNLRRNLRPGPEEEQDVSTTSGMLKRILTLGKAAVKEPDSAETKEVST